MDDLTVPPDAFSERDYLSANPDVAEAVRTGIVVSGWYHALFEGYREERPGLASDVKALVGNYWRSLEDERSHPVPPPGLRERVHGAADLRSFHFVGAQAARAIDAVLQTEGRQVPEDARVLDFGCGCGRVLSPLKRRHQRWRVVGSDIDGEAIAWCRRHLSDAAGFIVHRPRPPLPVKARTFDLVYAISVFTHLPEDLQMEWLDELRRIARPGGLLLLTVHPMDLAARAASGADDGFLYAKGAGTKGLPDFYQTTFHSREYIVERWSPYFAIVDIIRKGINNHQDLIVARRRGEQGRLSRLTDDLPGGRVVRRLLRVRG
jgi:SAM-dependent methyltransferase